MKNAIAALTWASAGCRLFDSREEQVETNPWIEEQLAHLHIGEKVGQLLCISPQSEDPQNLVQSAKASAAFLADGLTPEEVVRLGNRYQDLARLPVLIMGGVHCGLGERIRGATRLPCNMAIGATRSEEMARLAARVTVAEAKAMGIFWPGPTRCDVPDRLGGRITSTNSFGDSPELVTRLSAAMVEELQKTGCVGCASYFPFAGDVHGVSPDVSKEKVERDAIELSSFRTLIRSGVKAILVSQAAHPEAGAQDVSPMIFSKGIVTDLLRTELGFQGVVSSDAFSSTSGSSPNAYEMEEVILMSFQAGLDLLPAYPDTEKCHLALVKNLGTDPTLSRRLDNSVRRILALKYWLGLHQQRFARIQDAEEIVGKAEHQEAALEIARRAVTLVRESTITGSLRENPSHSLFIVPESQQRITGEWPHEELILLVQKALPQARVIRCSSDPDSEERRRLLKEAENAQKAAVAIFPRMDSHRGIPERKRELLLQLAEVLKLVLIGFGSPHVLSGLGDAGTLICSYDDSPASLRAAVELCSGQFEAEGRLPVQLEL